MSDAILQDVHRFLVQVAASLVVAIAVLWWLSLPPVAYDDWEFIEVSRQGDGVFVHGTYRKTREDCRYQSGRAYAVLPGNREAVPFEPIRGAGQTAQREPGLQHMRVVIDLSQCPWCNATSIQFWTRHDCAGQIVDSMMWEVGVPE
jgi:hypothetical protein